MLQISEDRRPCVSIGALAMAALLSSAPASAQIPFEARMNVSQSRPGLPTEAVRQTIRADTVRQLLELFRQSSLQASLPGYTRSTPLDAAIRIRGVPAQLSFPTSGPTLRLQVPGLGLDRSFTGRSRDQSLGLLGNALSGEGGLLNGELLRLGVRRTAIDPVAGNPNSLMANMLASASQTASGIGVGLAAAPGAGFAMMTGGVTSADGVTQGTLRAPLGWQQRLANGDSLLIDGVFHATRIDGRWEAYGGSFGLGYAWRVPVEVAGGTWTLTPAARFGVAGSNDLGAGSGMYALSATSALHLPARWAGEGASLSLGTTIAYLATVPVGIGDLSLNYGVRNWGFRNGVALHLTVGEAAGGRPLIATFHLADTRFAGTDLHVNAYQEIGVGLTLGGRVPVSVGVQGIVGQRGFGGVVAAIGLRF
jgi:hypothetical protein